MMRPLFLIALETLVATAPILPALAQGGASTSAAEIEAEITFARGLAQQLGFVDLAERVLDDVGKSGASGKQAEMLALVRCQLALEGAKIDAQRRDELLKQAIEGYEAFVSTNQFSDLRPQAESELIGALSMSARSLQIALESASGEKATQLKEQLVASLESTISRSNELVTGLSSIDPAERSESDSTRLFELLFGLGESQLMLAKVQDNPSFMFEQSLKAFERLSDEAGEGNPWSLRAMVGTGDVYSVMGEYSSAVDYYEFVVEQCIPLDSAAWEERSKGFTPAQKNQLWLFVQLATEGWVGALSANGKNAEAAKASLHFINTWKREGFELVAPYGYLSLLGVARALVNAEGFVGGGLTSGELQWYASPEAMIADHPAARNQRSALELALSQAQEVNDQTRGTNMQLRAQKVISSIIARPGVKVAPEVLFEAAQGEYNDRNYPAAIDSMKRVLAALDGADNAKRIELGPKVLFHIGVSLQRLGRSLEAAKAFEVALDRFAGDPEYDVKNADGFYNVMRELKRSLKGDAEVDRLFTKSEGLKAQFSTATAGDIDFGNGFKLWLARDWAQAQAKFATVGRDSDSYEKAQAYMGASLIMQDKFAEGDRVFDGYLNTFLNEPANRQVAGVRATRRDEARAVAVAFFGLSQFKQAEQSSDPAQWRKVIEVLDGYPARFKGQDDFSAAALYRIMIAHLRLDERPKAKELFEQLLKSFPNNKFTGYAATDYYKTLEAMRAKESDPQRKRAMLREMAENLQIANRSASEAKYPNLRKESDHWMELAEWATAEELLTRIRDVFQASEADKVNTHVLPDLAQAQVEQRKVKEAAETLRPLVEGDDKRPTQRMATTYARALAGWLEVEPGTPTKIVQVPGVGDMPALEAASKIYVKLDSAFPKYGPDWYENKFMIFYVQYLMGLQDSKKLEWVKGEMSKFATDLGAEFKHEGIAEPLRAKYLWLKEKLR